MRAPDCGHDDGWCGGPVLGDDYCARVRPPVRHHDTRHMDEQDLWDQRHGRRWHTPDDYHEGESRWDYKN